MSDSEIEQFAWEAFAGAHPHEAHEAYPERFWQFFKKRCPHMTREQMVATLKETEEITLDSVGYKLKPTNAGFEL